LDQLPTLDILGVQVSRLGFEEAQKACLDRLAQKRGGYVCFANVHTVTESLDSADLRGALNGSFLSVADGVPLVWVSKLYHAPIGSRVCGPDFMTEFLSTHRHFRHAFVGGKSGVADQLIQRFNLSQAISYCPPFRPYSQANALEDWNEVLKRSGGNAPDCVWVGLGAPKQELWMRAVQSVAPSTLFFGVGAAFDFLTGGVARAPVWMQQSGLEWFYRLLKEPKRLWKRYLSTNPRFVMRVLSQWVKAA
jgi:N-acetylglucosaminyldiphosphoundecaprenol N-acetyl-beta-D-mannosaminyltransferase